MKFFLNYECLHVFMREKFKLKSSAFLAPMAGITDKAFRCLASEYGASMTVTDLISSKAILQGNLRTKELYRRGNEKNCFAVQLFGDSPDDFSRAAKIVEPECDVIDINMGCPAPKVCKIGAGSQLLTNPEKVGKIVRSVVNAVDIPVSVKIRTGIDENSITAIDVAKQIEDNGASLLIVHGRTKSQGYSGEANWDTIKQIKERVNIPVAGNGDIKSPIDVKNRMDETGVDYVAIGRGASGNPFLFKQINDYLLTGNFSETTASEKLQAFERYVKLSIDENISFLNRKLQAQHFIRGCDGATKARLKLNSTKTDEELVEVVENVMNVGDTIDDKDVIDVKEGMNNESRN